MCQQQRDPGADAQTFDDIAGLLAALRPGMDVCTSDFTGWADIVEVRPDDDGGTIVAIKRADQAVVHVPADVVIGIHHDQCVRVDRSRATIDKQGWEAGASATS